MRCKRCCAGEEHPSHRLPSFCHGGALSLTFFYYSPPSRRYKEAAPNQDVDTPQIWIDRDQLSTFIKDKTKDCLSDDPSVRTWDSVLCTIEYTAGKPPLTIAISSNDGIIADGQHV